MWQSLTEAVFSFSVSKRKIILWFFLILYAFLTIIILFALRTAVTGSNYLFLYPQAILSGKISLVVFCLVMVPGIARRFGIRHKLIFPLMVYRRYLGIAMFLLAMFHATVVRFASFVEEGLPFKNLLWFEILGLAALFFLSFMFVTSNDFSVKYLGFWWHRLHKLIYIIMWLILFHVGLQRMSVWSILLGVTVLIQSVSFLYAFRKKQLICPKKEVYQKAAISKA